MNPLAEAYGVFLLGLVWLGVIILAFALLVILWNAVGWAVTGVVLAWRRYRDRE